MIEALHFLRKAIIDRLSGSIVLNSQNVPVYNRVPSNATEPFIKVYSLQNEETDFNRDSYMLDCITRIDVVTSFDGDSGGELDANEIVSQVLTLVRTREGNELVQNGNFADGSNNWTKLGDVEITGGEAVFFGTDELSRIKQENVFKIGQEFTLNYEITSYTSGSLSVVRFGVDDNNGMEIPTTVGWHSVTANAFQNDLQIKRKGDPTTLNISNISVKAKLSYFNLAENGLKVYSSVLMNTTYFEEDAENKSYFRAIIELSNKVQKI